MLFNRYSTGTVREVMRFIGSRTKWINSVIFTSVDWSIKVIRKVSVCLCVSYSTVIPVVELIRVCNSLLCRQL